MSNFCTFFPTDAQCQTTDDVQPVQPDTTDSPINLPDLENSDDIMDITDSPTQPIEGSTEEPTIEVVDVVSGYMESQGPILVERYNPLYGQITFLLVALASAAQHQASIYSFYLLNGNYIYELQTTTDVQGGTNYFLTSSKIRHYGGLGISSVLAFTQLLSLFGVFNELNELIWTIGIVAYTLTMLVSTSLSMYAFYLIDGCSQGKISCTQQGSASSIYMNTAVHFPKEVAADLAKAYFIQSQYKNWYYAQWRNFSVEKKQKLYDEAMEQLNGEAKFFAF